MDSKARVVEVVSRKLPQNKLGLPDGIFRADLLLIPQALLTAPIATMAPSPESQSTGEVGDLVQDPNDSPSVLPSDGVEVLPPDSSTSATQVAETPGPWDSATIAGLPEDKFDPFAAQKQEDDKLLALLKNADIHVAYVPLSYHEGFPTLSDQTPFWELFAWEPAEAHRAFKAYIKMGKKGARTLFDLANALPDHPDFQGGSPPSLSELTEWFHLYYWAYRSRAFDLFHVAARRKNRAQLIMDMEDNHYKKATKLWGQLMTYMNPGGEFWETITPQAAVQMLKILPQIQRMSLGLPANGVGSNVDTQSDAGVSSLEVVLRQIAESGGVSSDANNAVGDNSQAVQEDFRRDVLKNPESVRNVQELIIRMTNVRNPGMGNHGVTL